MPVLLFFLLILVSIIFVLPLSIAFHELGHAFPALLFTKKEVTIYIGTQKPGEEHISFNAGRLAIRWKFNLIRSGGGLCKSDISEISLRKQILILAGGPLVSILTAVASIQAIRHLHLFGPFNGLLTIVAIVNCMFFLFSAIPVKPETIRFSGQPYQNDITSILILIQTRKLPASIKEGYKLLNEKKYAEAAAYFEECILNGAHNKEFYRTAALSHLMNKDYEKAKAAGLRQEKVHKLSSNDYTIIGTSFVMLHEMEAAKEYLIKALSLNRRNVDALNNLGYSFGVTGKYAESIHYLDEAIGLNRSYAYAYANRGFAKIGLGKMEEALKDIEKSIALDDTNSYAYRNLGLYHVTNGNPEKALPLFKKALEMDTNTYKIQELIRDTEKALGLSSSAV